MSGNGQGNFSLSDEAADALNIVINQNRKVDDLYKEWYITWGKSKLGFEQLNEIFRLINLGLKHRDEVEFILKKLQLFTNNYYGSQNRNLAWQYCKAIVLMADFLWGSQILKSSSSIVGKIKYHEEEIKDFIEEAVEVNANNSYEVFTRLKRPRYVRINTLRISVGEAIQSFINDGWTHIPKEYCQTYKEYLHTIRHLKQGFFVQDFHIFYLLAFPAGTLFINHPQFQNGHCLFQDKGSCMSSFLLNPRPNSSILELGSAPGYKTNHLACILNNNGKIYAIEINEERFKDFVGNMSLTNCSCVKPMHKDFFKLSSLDFPDINYILVNPCSTSSGLLEYSKYSNIESDHAGVSLTRALLHAVKAFPTVEKVVYTTNSILYNENEKVIEEVLKEVGDKYELLDIKEISGLDWISFSNSKSDAVSSKCLYTKPENDYAQGHFVAIFKKNIVYDFLPMPMQEKYKNMF